MAPILITGATGSTGRAAIKHLLQKGLAVRAFVHKEDDRSRQLEAQGAEVVIGDLLDLRSVRHAFEGVKRAYFVYPITARADAPSNAALNHWLAERVFDWAGTPLIFAGKMIKEEDRFAVPFGPSGKSASVSTEDLGELTAALLENPADHTGQTYPLFGPTELTPLETANVLSQHLGREIRYEKVSASVLIRSFAGIEIPYLEQHFDAASEMYRDGLLAGTNDWFEKIIGHPSQSLEEFVEQNKSIWEKK
ncbi:NAD(P)-binding protein [Trichoderma austrokoningii]